MDTLGKLFGSVDRVKIMRLFLLNPELVLSTKEVTSRSKTRLAGANRELKLLEGIGLLKYKKKGNLRTWQLEPAFPALAALGNLLKSDMVGRKKRLTEQFSRCGKISLLVIAGVFLENPESRADLLIVGTKLRRAAISQAIKSLEAEIGKELSYAVLETSDFQYRLNACDRFVRDVFDYPHTLIVDKLGLASSSYSAPGLSTVR